MSDQKPRPQDQPPSADLPGTEANPDHPGQEDHRDESTHAPRFGWKTRIKLAVVLSFLVLLGIQLSGRFQPGGGKRDVKAAGTKPPALAIGEGVAQASNEVVAGETKSAVEQASLTAADPNTPAPAPPKVQALVDLTSRPQLPPTPGHIEPSVAVPTSVAVEQTPPAPAKVAAESPIQIPDAPPTSVAEPAPTVLAEPPASPPLAEPTLAPSASSPPPTFRPQAPPAATAEQRPLVPPVSAAAVATAAAVPVARATQGVSPRELNLATPPELGTGQDELFAPRESKPASRAASNNVVGGRIDPITHVVRRGENFWTIARHYYGSGRFYKALWKANEQRVPRIDQLYIGTPILVPAPEDLDRAFVDPPGKGASRAKPAEMEEAPALARGSSTRDDAVTRTSTSGDTLFVVDDPGLKSAATAPPEQRKTHYRTYISEYGDTLRKIAARELGDAHRDTELERLNADHVDDPFRIPVGTSLRLPLTPKPD